MLPAKVGRRLWKGPVAYGSAHQTPVVTKKMIKQTMIDFRSDTLTKPSPAMLEAMMNADVGDDVWGDDPTVNRLQEMTAAMFGHEAGLFCPSGTMTNQIAIKVYSAALQQCSLAAECNVAAHND
jgi:threonine aldolase